MRTSLWLDETITYWTIKDSTLLGAIRKTLDNPPQSPAYTPFAWTAVAIGGPHEVVLRLPSLAAVALAAYLLYRVGARLLDREAGFLAAVVFAYWYGPSAGTNARPYALAMLAVIASTLYFLRWLDDGRLRDAAVYVFLATAFMHLQPLYAPVLGLHLLLAWEHGGQRFSRVVTVLAAVGVLSAPFIWHLSALRHRVVTLTFSNVLSWSGAAPLIVVSALLAGALLLVRRRLPFNPPTLTLIAWTIGPLPLLVGLGQATGFGMVVWRYFAYVTPGVALTVAAILRALGPFKRFSLMACFALVAVLSFDAASVENWREGAARVRSLGLSPDTPVLVRTGIPEGREWYRAPERFPYLMTPMSFYPVPGELIPLPYKLDTAAVDYLEHEVIPSLRAARRVVIFAHDYEYSESMRLPFQAWFDLRLPNFVSRQIWRESNLVVLVYDRRATP
jgi:hypothetical protein